MILARRVRRVRAAAARWVKTPLLALVLGAALLPEARPALAQALPAAPSGRGAAARPQDPQPPLPYRSEDVRYPNPAAGIQLAGTLTLPSGPGPFPAAVLISGSGPQNRNDETYDHRTFLVLADFLTRRGIAVLRSDDRGVGASGGIFDQATTQDFASDAAAAVAYLRTRVEIRREAVGLIGHSEGGLVAPIVATGPQPVAFLVLMAAPALPGEEILYQQSSLVARATGLPEAQITYNRQVQGELFAVIKAEPDDATRHRRMGEVLRSQFTALSPEERAATGLSRDGEEEWVQTQVRSMGGPWFRFFLMHDPLAVLRQVRVPVLALGGDRDLQVPAEPNLRLIEETLREVGAPGSQVARSPGLNHLFQTAATGIPAEYWDIQETMDPAAMETIAGWITQRTGGS